MSDEGNSATEEVYATMSRRKGSRAKTCYDLAMNRYSDKDESVEKKMCETLGIDGIEEGESDEMQEILKTQTTVVDNAKVSSCSTFSSE